MKLTEAKQSEKICPFCSLSLEAKNRKQKEANSFFASKSKIHAKRMSFRFEAKKF
jgi:hypothetical protein